MAKKKCYAVAVGRNSGVYNKWCGKDGAEDQVRGFPNAVFKGFANRKEAENFLKKHDAHQARLQFKYSETNTKPKNNTRKKPIKFDPVIIHADGACIRNPGPGGYGVVLRSGNKRKELSGGFRFTTNNRMELSACIVGLSKLKSPSKATLHSDSKYVVNGIKKGWAKRWRSNNWMRTKEDPAINPDLWGRLLDLCDRHDVKFVWVKGHAGNPDNERCDRLATQAASKRNLPADKIYEANKYGSSPKELE